MTEQRCAACREDVEAWKADHVFDLNDCLTLVERHHTLFESERARGDRLEAALVGYLTLKNPNGKAYTRRLQELHADARRALGKDGP